MDNRPRHHSRIHVICQITYLFAGALVFFGLEGNFVLECIVNYLSSCFSLENLYGRNEIVYNRRKYNVGRVTTFTFSFHFGSVHVFWRFSVVILILESEHAFWLVNTQISLENASIASKYGALKIKSMTWWRKA